MSERRVKREVSELTASASEGFRSLLIPIEMSPLSDRVLGRVALLPVAETCRLTLLHVVPGSLSLRDQRVAQRDAQKALNEEARVLRAKLPKAATVEPSVKVGAPATQIATSAASMRADLIVMGRGGGRTIRDIFLGSTAERVIRRGQRPVLAVRLPPRAVYSRPLLALAVDQAARDAVALLLRLIPPPRKRLPVVHAFDIPYYGTMHRDLSDDDAERLRGQYRRDATHQIAHLLRTALVRARVAPNDAPSWTMHVRHGSPRAIIKKLATQADTDLLVLGTRGRTGAAHAFLGTVAGDVLRDVACDTLVVPPRRDRSR
jgi:nucleotide-binding universal stress UspA family protein